MLTCGLECEHWFIALSKETIMNEWAEILRWGRFCWPSVLIYLSVGLRYMVAVSVLHTCAPFVRAHLLVSTLPGAQQAHNYREPSNRRMAAHCCFSRPHNWQKAHSFMCLRLMYAFQLEALMAHARTHMPACTV